MASAPQVVSTHDVAQQVPDVLAGSATSSDIFLRAAHAQGSSGATAQPRAALLPLSISVSQTRNDFEKLS